MIKNFSLELNSKKGGGVDEKKKIIQRKFSTNYLENKIKNLFNPSNFLKGGGKNFKNPKPALIKNLNTHNSCVW